MTKRCLIYGLSVLLTLFSCSQEEKVDLREPGGTVSIRFATRGLQSTKATTPGNGVVADGGGLYIDGSGDPDLVILIVDNNTDSPAKGNIVITYPGANATKTSSSATESVIKFDFATASLPAGNYMVYAFGNTGGLWTMTTTNAAGNDTIEISGSDLTDATKISKGSQLEALAFKPQSRVTIGWEDPGYAGEWDDGVAIENSRLPVSAKAPLTVSSRMNGEARLELLRCVAKVTAKIINNMDTPLSLYDYKHTVHNINPTSGYVIQHDDDYIGTAGNLLANPPSKYSDSSLAIPIAAAPSGSQEYDFYVFPSQGPFRICIQFTLNKGNTTPPVDPGDPPLERTDPYNNLPGTNWRAEDILEVRRNQHLTVETRISQGVQVSFNFVVAEWEEHTESVTFD